MAIPIANLYHLLAYAWNRLPEAELAGVTVEPGLCLPDLLARVLAGGVTRVLKRGPDRAYAGAAGEIAGVRGRLDLAESLKRASFPRGRAHCTYDELTPDVPHNQIVRTTLSRLASVDGLDPANAQRLRALHRRMVGVREISLAARDFGRVALGRNNAYYGFLLDVCAIVHRHLMVDERSGRATFRDFRRDDAEMARLFEQFVANFFAHHARRGGYDVRAQQPLRWAAGGAPADIAYLPRMQTDVVLRGPAGTLVLDTKYYASALQEHFGRATIRPAHLYQLHAYLSNYPRAEVRGELRGVLLYPRTTRTLRVAVRLHGRPVDVWTLDLAQPWREVEADLLRVGSIAAVGAPTEPSQAAFDMPPSPP